VSAVGDLAEELGAPERTLRRAVAIGAIRSRRLSERRLRLADGEVQYLRAHWDLLADLRGALRTEPKVRVAILAGSLARGEGHGLSDIDLVVDLDSERTLDRMRLAMRLGEKLDREVDVASLDRVEADPLSLLQILDEGRVIVDRDRVWPQLRGQRSAVHKRAARSYRRQQEQLAVMLARELH
jgi:predicted nucleotidyltransferase